MFNFAQKVFVVHVIDGDTFIGIDGNKRHRYRLKNIDAPELKNKSSNFSQPFAEEALIFLRSRIENKTIFVSVGQKDHYERFLCDAVTVEGNNISLDLLFSGFAHFERYDSSFFNFKLIGYRFAQWHAKLFNKGIWSLNSNNLVHPKNFRRSKFD